MGCVCNICQCHRLICDHLAAISQWYPPSIVRKNYEEQRRWQKFKDQIFTDMGIMDDEPAAGQMVDTDRKLPPAEATNPAQNPATWLPGKTPFGLDADPNRPVRGKMEMRRKSEMLGMRVLPVHLAGEEG